MGILCQRLQSEGCCLKFLLLFEQNLRRCLTPLKPPLPPLRKSRPQRSQLTVKQKLLLQRLLLKSQMEPPRSPLQMDPPRRPQMGQLRPNPQMEQPKQNPQNPQMAQLKHQKLPQRSQPQIGRQILLLKRKQLKRLPSSKRLPPRL